MKAMPDITEAVQFPEGFTVRGAALPDVESCLELFNRWSQSVIGQDEITDAEAIRREWVSPNFDPSRDIRLVFSDDKTLVGYVEVWTTANPPVHPWIWGRVHPDYGDQGIGTWLLNWAETHACKALERVPDDLRFALRLGTFRQAEESKRLFEENGYTCIRGSYQMRIEMKEAPPAPIWPEGIVLRTFQPEDAEAVYRATDEAFRDHFGHMDQPFDEGFKRFKHFMIDVDDFDPTLWYLAMDGNEVAGICLCRPRGYDDPKIGYVNTLGVRRPWRKRGLGLAFLHHTFGDFYRRGKKKVGLGVDAQNLTGALKLYERAGMSVHIAFDLFEKEIRSGREFSVESLQ